MTKINFGTQCSGTPTEEEAQRTQVKSEQHLQRECNEEMMPNIILLYSQASQCLVQPSS